MQTHGSDGSDAHRAQHDDDWAERAIRALWPILVAQATHHYRDALRDRATPEDIANDVLIMYIERFDARSSGSPPPVPFSDDSIGYASRSVRGHMAKLFRQRATEHGYVEDLKQRTAAAVTSASKVVARSERNRIISEWVGGLCEFERTLLIEHGVEGRTLKDLARPLEVSHDALRKRWQAFKRRARQELQRRGIREGTDFIHLR